MELNVLKDTMRRFGREVLAPAAAETESDGAIAAAHWAELANMGLTGVMAAEAYGGAGAGLPEALVIAEELGRACTSTAWQWLEHTNATVALNGFANDALKESLLRPLAAGTLVGAAMKTTEAGGGSDMQTLRTYAVPSGDKYVLNGTKVFQSLAGAADVYLVVAREGSADAAAMSIFAVGRSAPGLSFGPRERTMGLGGIAVGDIIMDDCTIPAGNLIGKPGGFGPVFGAIGGFATLGASAIAIGMMQASFDETLTFLAGREVGARTLGSLHGIQMQVADLFIEIESTRALVARALESAGPPTTRFATKVKATDVAAHVIDRCLLLHGNAGYSRALPFERRARDVRALAIHYGNNDVFRANIGQMLLNGAAGKP